MKALILIMAVLFSASVEAKDVSIPNKDGGSITFTSYQGSCKDGRLAAYATSNGGQIVITGCWFYMDDNEKAYIVWEDGTVYEYK